MRHRQEGVGRAEPHDAGLPARDPIDGEQRERHPHVGRRLAERLPDGEVDREVIGQQRVDERSAGGRDGRRVAAREGVERERGGQDDQPLADPQRHEFAAPATQQIRHRGDVERDRSVEEEDRASGAHLHGGQPARVPFPGGERLSESA